MESGSRRWDVITTSGSADVIFHAIEDAIHVNMPLWASTGPVLALRWQHWPSTSPVLARSWPIIAWWYLFPDWLKYEASDIILSRVSFKLVWNIGLGIGIITSSGLPFKPRTGRILIRRQPEYILFKSGYQFLVAIFFQATIFRLLIISWEIMTVRLPWAFRIAKPHRSTPARQVRYPSDAYHQCEPM